MKTPDAVAKEILAKLAVTAPGFSLELGTPERKIVDAVSEAISEAYVDQYLIGSLMDTESKAGIELEQWVGIFGFGRLQGRQATGIVRVEMKNSSPQDITIPAGSPFYTRQALPSTGNPLYFSATEAVVIPAGSYEADVAVQCNVVGTAGNVPPDSIVFVNDILGATSVTNLQAFTGGVDVETDDELRQRFKDTFMRNVTGTEDFYLGLCYQNKHVSKAACFGPIRKYATQVEISDDIDLTSYIDQDVKYVWPGEAHVHVFKDLGQSSETFYQIEEDFEWLAGSSPSLTRVPGGTLTDGDIVDLEFEYTTRSSRNDPRRGVTNKIDIFVNGNDPYLVSERTTIDSAIVITDTATDQLYRNNFTRVGPSRVRSSSSLTNATMSEVTITGEDPYVVSLTNSPTGGSFALSYGGETTTAIPYDASAAVVQSALAALSTIGSGNVTVNSSLSESGGVVADSYSISLTVSTSVLTGTSSLTNATASQAVVDGTTVKLTNTPTGGSYQLLFGSQTTTDIPYNSSPATVQAALESLSNVGAGNVTVSGTSDSYTIVFSAETKIPTVGNRFMRLGSTPVASFPSTLVVDGQTYTQGVDYYLLKLTPESLPSPNDTTLLAGSIYETVGLEWESTGPAPVAPETRVPLTISYSQNRVPEVVQAVIKTGKQITTDVIVHQASYAYIRVYLSIEYDRGFVVSQVNNAIQERLRAYFAGLPYGAWVEVSDLTLAAHQVLGVDNISLVLSTDVGVGENFGMKVYADSSDTVPLVTHPGDFKLHDNQLPVFLDAVITRKANR